MKIILYDEDAAEELDVAEIARYLRQKLGKVKIETRGSPFGSDLAPDSTLDFARKIAGAKVQEVNQRIPSEPEPLPGEVEYEKRKILRETRACGIIYEGFRLRRIFGEVIPEEERSLEFVHLIFTNRLLATWDNNNRRYHLRASIYSIPSVISTTGLIEAPAKPREYYLLKQQYERLGKDLTGLKEIFKGRFIDYGDKRLTEVAKGYAMQAVFYALAGDPFCGDKGCRLYNAHWQEELIFAQLDSGYEFCLRHTGLLEKGVAADTSAS